VQIIPDHASERMTKIVQLTKLLQK